VAVELEKWTESSKNIIDNSNEHVKKNSKSLRSQLLKISLALVTPLIIITLLSGIPNLFTMTGTDHFYIEIFSTLLCFIISYYCIWRGYALKDKLSIFVGLGFHVAGVIDLLHGVFSIMNLGIVEFEEYFIPQTWVAGRILLGLVMLIAICKIGHDTKTSESDNNSIRKNILFYSVLLSSLAAFITTISLTQPFPFITLDFTIKRPYELISLFFFLTALIYFFKNKLNLIDDSFHKTILVTLVINIFSSTIISWSEQVFDTAFSFSHILKIASYFIFVLAISSSSLSHYKKKNELSEELKVVNERLHSNERKYKDLYENSPAMYRTINTEGMILDCNRAYAQTLGYSKGEIIGSSIFDYVPPERMNEIKDSFYAWRNTGRVWNREVWLVKKNGEHFPTLLSAGNIFDTDGHLIGSNTVIRDISEIYSTKKKLEKAYEELKLTERQKEEFSSMITHELKTPLTPIIGYCQALQHPTLLGKLSLSQHKAVSVIYSNAERLQKLVGDVLYAHRLDLDEMQFAKRAFQTNEVFDDLEKDYEYLIDKTNTNVYFILNENIILVSDKEKVIQILNNLVFNSLDFVPEKSGKIEISVEEIDGFAKFSVKDNGVGISKEKQQNLFKKFYQVDISLTRKHGGAGLGLAICKGIVEKLGGKIWVESEKGSGTCFNFTIPLK